jgi:hypothetical protein
MAKLREAIYEVLDVDNPMTVRQVFYRLVALGIIDKTENDYKNAVGRVLLQLRREGEVPYRWVADNTRWMRKPSTWPSVEGMLEHTARTYRRDLWADQNVYVELWCEKDALAGVIMEETGPWDVPLMVTKGFSSETYLYEAAQAIIAEEKPAYLYYFGDHDPSGVMIDRSIRRHLARMAPEAEIHFQRVAVLPEQIRELRLPTRPTKKSGSHGRHFKGRSVELDAIPAQQLRLMVRECIEQHVDQRAFEITKIAEGNERELLARLCEQLGDR